MNTSTSPAEAQHEPKTRNQRRREAREAEALTRQQRAVSTAQQYRAVAVQGMLWEHLEFKYVVDKSAEELTQIQEWLDLEDQLESQYLVRFDVDPRDGVSFIPSIGFALQVDAEKFREHWG